MSTAFKSLQIPPGVVAMPTKKMLSSNWMECNLVRWRDQRMSPVGGQLKYAYPIAMASRCKCVHGWYGLDGIFRVAYLCETNLYVDVGGIGASLTDITPSGGMTALPLFNQGGYGDGLYGQGVQLATTAPFTTSSPNITMAPNLNQVTPGMVVFDVTTGLSVGTVSTYVGTALVLTANALSAGSAGDVLDFGAYGDPRGSTPTSIQVTSLPNAFSLDNFGSVLYAMTSADGRLLMWDPAVGGAAVVQPPVSGRGPVPHGRCFIVTPERFIMIFGSNQDGTTGGGGPRRFAWCDQENPGAWDYSSVTSQAGFLDIEPASPIICAEATRVGNIFWTGKKCYVSRFLGIPYIYNYSELGDATAPWSAQSVVTTSSLTLWMSEQGMFSFDGTSIMPVACPARPWVDADIDPINVREQACAVHVENFNEWWWFFPQASAQADAATGRRFNTRAIIYNYKEGWFSQANMCRSAGVTAAYNSHTIMTNGTIAYEHESLSSNTYSVEALLPFAETFDLNVYAGGGSRLITVKQLIPDIDSDDPNPAGAIAGLQYSLYYRNSRSLGAPERQAFGVGPVPSYPGGPTRTDGYIDFRVTGRDVRLRIEVVGPTVPDFTVGQHLIDAVPRGDR